MHDHCGGEIGLEQCEWTRKDCNDDNLCTRYHLLGQGRDGGMAELVAVPQANVMPKPPNLSFKEAASIPLVFTTALHMILTRAHLRYGETVLVNAAGSGVGVAAIQVAKLHGAGVIASAGYPWWPKPRSGAPYGWLGRDSASALEIFSFSL